MELPEEFRSSMKRLLGKGYDAFCEALNAGPVASIRINTSKISNDEFEKIAPYPVTRIPFISNGYYINDADAWSGHPYYYAGLYYIQEASAMLPASVLNVQKGDIVLDLCAAPGGKSTELSISDASLLISNDISQTRTIPLVKNLERFGSTCYMVTCESPQKLSVIYPEIFDRILIDAPCSGEGMFRKDRSLIRSYREKGPSYYSPVQSEILEYAYRMLKPGGIMLYSTCTYSDIEDEQVVIKLIEAHDDLSVCDISKTNGLSGPYDIYKDDDRISGCARALPHLFRGEGHFMAMIKKEGSDIDRTVPSYDRTLCFEEIEDKISDFACHFSDDLMKRFKEKRFILNDGGLYMLPDGFMGLFDPRLRYRRTGTCIGTINRSGKFVPHTAFALTLSCNDYTNTLCYDTNDANVIKYLKGETLIVDGIVAEKLHKGVVLMCAGRYPLGFSVYDGTKLKNLYEKGWVYR